MLSLPTDIQFLILDYIVTREDFKTLCLTSRALHGYTIPRMYERIDIHIWKRSEIVRFVHSVAAGAGMNLRHTRSLVIEDERLPAEPEMVHGGTLEVPVTISPYPCECRPKERDNHLCMILNMFPKDGLRRFSFVSQRAISSSVKEQLRVQQHALQIVQSVSAPELHQDFRDIRELDVFLRTNEDTETYLQNPFVFGEHIQHLRLTADHSQYKPQLTTEPTPTLAMPKLKSLTLTCIDVTFLFQPLSTLYNVPGLTHLCLLMCKGADKFTLALGVFARTNKLSLEHIAIDLEHMSGIYGICFADVFSACEVVKGLHLSWQHGAPSPHLLQIICTLGRRLELLSLGRFGNEGVDEPVPAKDFEAICDACPGLKQLAYQIPEAAYLAPESLESFEQFMLSLKRLPNLRILHLRVPRFHLLGSLGPRNACNPDILAMHLQNFANRFFSELRRLRCCPLLDALVIGHACALEPESPLPQSCFVKGEQRDVLGRTTAVGVLVSRAIVRLTQQDTGVLDLDSLAGAWNGWAGRVTA